jgi:hypothetical protein
MQGFYPNDRMAYPLYEAINDGGAIALFHTGQTGVGSGMPGGMGMRLKYSNPMYMDDVAADFPDLRIILAHPSFPWQEEALSVATHKPNVYIDLSGWSPKYFPPILVRYINSILQDKMLFGSDWPVITPDRWLADFAKLDIRDEIRPKVLDRATPYSRAAAIEATGRGVLDPPAFAEDDDRVIQKRAAPWMPPDSHYGRITTHSRLPAFVASSMASGKSASGKARGRIAEMSSMPARSRSNSLR